LSSKLGFSVVAPISVTSPSSTAGSSVSCWPLLRRWISSTNSTVRPSPRASLACAAAKISRSRGTPSLTALNGSKACEVVRAMSRASVVFPVPGGPQNTIDPMRPFSIAARSGLPGPSR
jgi:hypothetical protein